jgi:ABC-type uncharacterized transport system permease subunit
MVGRRVVVERRGTPSVPARVLFPLGSVLGAGIIGGLFLLAAGHDPLEAYRIVLRSGFGSALTWVRTLISATPLILTAIAVAVAFRMKIWNIGGEGQLLVGAIAASGVALAIGDSVPSFLAVTASLAAGVLAGAFWASLAALPRAYLHTDEVISTLMLNFVGLYLMNYLIFGSVSFWRDREALSFPRGRLIPLDAELPQIWMRLSLGLPIAVAVAMLFWWILRSSRWGFEIRVIGDSPLAGRYAGMSVPRTIVSVLLVSGGIAGLAGAILVTGSTHSLAPGSLALGLGYTGIVVAAVSRFNPLAVVPVAVLVAGLSNAGSSLQVLGVPSEIVVLLQGLILLLVAAAEFLRDNRVRLVRREDELEAQVS